MNRESPAIQDIRDKRVVLIVADELPDAPMVIENVRCVLYDQTPFCRMVFDNGSILLVTTAEQLRKGIDLTDKIDCAYITDEAGMTEREKESLLKAID